MDRSTYLGFLCVVFVVTVCALFIINYVDTRGHGKHRR